MCNEASCMAAGGAGGGGAGQRAKISCVEVTRGGDDGSVGTTT